MSSRIFVWALALGFEYAAGHATRAAGDSDLFHNVLYGKEAQAVSGRRDSGTDGLDFAWLSREGIVRDACLRRYAGPFTCLVDAFAVMPDHLHVLLTPAPNVSLEKAIQLIRGGFSFRLKSRFDVWERGHFDKRIKDRAGYEACVDYIHANPVKAGLVEHIEEYPFSSAFWSVVDAMPKWFEEPGAKAPTLDADVTAG